METSLFVWFGGILGGNVGAFMSYSSLLNKNDGFTTESHLYFCVNYTFLQPKTICITSRPNVIYQLAIIWRLATILTIIIILIILNNRHHPYHGPFFHCKVFAGVWGPSRALSMAFSALLSLYFHDGADEDDAYIQSRRGGGVWFSTSQSENLNCLRQNIFQVLKNTISWSSSCSF